ncbi:MAG TPA: glycoside hydrolase family 15 protein [Gemmatimonadales bacterium]|nr:glycoside hydrolase family 15 protein [Gemmatimonadales bacterium]
MAEGEEGGAFAQARPRYLPIEAYAVIGDLQTVALVAKDASIDFLCLPEFDSPSVFARILDADDGGCFTIEPEFDGSHTKQLYLPDTNVLLTRFLSDAGVLEVSDFMPIHERLHPSRIVRRVKAVRGRTRFRVRCCPRFDYARARHTAELTDCGVVFRQAGGGLELQLATPVALRLEGHDAVGEHTLAEGESVAFVLEHVPPGARPAGCGKIYVTRSFKQTVNFWRTWIGGSTYQGRWRDEVYRSALALKLLHSRRTGALVAAPTFGLPEVIGGERNWDYRYTWIRDASFTLYSLIRLGLTAETKAFIDWLVSLVHFAEQPGSLRTVYRIDGSTDLPEHVLANLEGYRDSRPVRVGNAAVNQLQLDIYGELMDALYLYDKYGEPTSHDLWARIAGLVDWVCKHWDQPDEGVWEVRSGRHDFLYSRIMCWVAIDRGIRLAMKRSFPAPLVDWLAARDAIYRQVFERFWDPEQGAFVGHLGSRQLDASCLVMPLVRFISPTDPRWLSTLRAVERELVSDSLVFRYNIHGAETDGLTGVEGTFSICSFWYIECVSRSGDAEKARYLFEKMLGYANHVGLFSEEIGPTGELLGNFPQAFTHLALISAAYDLDRRLSGKRWLA